MSKLENEFIELWRKQYPEIYLEREVRLIPDRRFRFDYVHVSSRTVIEVNGGVYCGAA